MTMRAKMRVSAVEQVKTQEGTVTAEKLRFNAVAKNEAYPADGADEDNTYARWSPTAELNIYVANPNLFGKFEVGQKFYVDFTPAAA